MLFLRIYQVSDYRNTITCMLARSNKPQRSVIILISYCSYFTCYSDVSMGPLLLEYVGCQVL